MKTLADTGVSWKHVQLETFRYSHCHFSNDAQNNTAKERSGYSLVEKTCAETSL